MVFCCTIFQLKLKSLIAHPVLKTKCLPLLQSQWYFWHPVHCCIVLYYCITRKLGLQISLDLQHFHRIFFHQNMHFFFNFKKALASSSGSSLRRQCFISKGSFELFFLFSIQVASSVAFLKIQTSQPSQYILQQCWLWSFKHKQLIRIKPRCPVIASDWLKQKSVISAQ